MTNPTSTVPSLCPSQASTNSKVVTKDPIKLTLSRGSDQARQKILKTYKRLSDMEDD
jgi:hypothetical protein